MSVKEFINKDSNINLVFISGGPGLSSISFNGLISLKEKYSLHFIDPMGTNSELKETPTYKNLLIEVKESIKHLDNVILCGHSFGGIQAVDIASDNLENIKGLIIIGSPMSTNAFSILGQNFEKGITENQNLISDKLENEPTDEIYKEWFYEYRNFYFNPKKADEFISIIMNDSVCVKSYSEAIVESSQKQEKLEKLNNINIPKLFITGSLDQVMPPDSAQHESKLGGLKLKIIKGAGHFVHYECPEEIIKVINNFLTNEGNK
jgi:pimeloyl-ACP methyl ester carboxylesterase